ncbi:divalent-cation tolerance protein CutA [Glaciecola sp. 1036]|uniref:divalent-cation tolerance protein CutA n=1 Tax=Alteromonadaceae TaxID=72275 RepID=UPI003D018ABE
MELAIAYIPCANASSAKYIAKMMIEAKLAVCGNIIPEVISIFSGDTDVQQEMESLLLLKHDKAKFADLIQAVSEIHPYDTPCITQIEVKDTNKEYLQWCNMILE